MNPSPISKDDAQAPAERRIAIVTGGSRGIGRGIVEQLAQRDVEVHFSYVQRAEAAEELVSALRAQGKTAVASRVDARDAAAVAAFVEATVDSCGKLDLLIHNAAITRDRLLARMSDDEWTSVLETSLNGLFGACRVAARQMMRQRAGRIINITSVSGLTGIAGQTNYSAAKAAIIGFTRSLSKELAPVGVPVNAVAPGFVDTDMLGSFTEQQRTSSLARVPMRRFGRVDEVANLVCYLALDAPTYMTGQTLVIDGGLT